MNKIILSGVRDIKTDELLPAQRDFEIILKAERTSEEKMDTFVDSDTEEFKYRLKVSELISIKDLGENRELKISKGQTQSQKWRFIVEQELGEYDNFMNWLMSNQQKIFDLYRETLCVN